VDWLVGHGIIRGGRWWVGGVCKEVCGKMMVEDGQ